MQTLMRVRRGRLAVAGLVAVLLSCAPGTAAAESDGRAATLQRAVGNMLLGPFDIALTPAVMARTLWVNGRAAGYGPAGRATFGLLGTGWLLPLTAATGAFRTWSGLIELPIGLGLLATKSFIDWTPPPLFDVEREPAMIDYPNAVVPIKIGVDYIGTPG